MPLIFVSINGAVKGASTNTHSKGNDMRIGIECFVVTDVTTGKKGLRLFPYIEASDKQKTILAAATAIILFAGTVLLLSCQTPDPITHPTVNLLP